MRSTAAWARRRRANRGSSTSTAGSGYRTIPPSQRADVIVLLADGSDVRARPAPSAESYYNCAVTFALAGLAVLAAAFVKGAIAFGFPTLGTPLLSLVMDVKT